MAETGDIMQAGALFRSEIAGVRVEQMQGNDVLGRVLQRFHDRRSVHEARVRPVSLQKFPVQAGEDALVIGVQGDFTAVRERFHCFREAEERRHVIFAAYRRKMSGCAAVLTDHARRAGKKRCPARVRTLHYQDSALRKGKHVKVAVHDMDRAERHAAAHGYTALQQNFFRRHGHIFFSDFRLRLGSVF